MLGINPAIVQERVPLFLVQNLSDGIELRVGLGEEPQQIIYIEDESHSEFMVPDAIAVFKLKFVIGFRINYDPCNFTEERQAIDKLLPF